MKHYTYFVSFTFQDYDGQRLYDNRIITTKFQVDDEDSFARFTSQLIEEIKPNEKQAENTPPFMVTNLTILNFILLKEESSLL